MAKLTSSQVASKLGVTSYTVKRWYTFYENLENTDVKELDNLIKNGMPTLPQYEVAGSRGDRIWDEDDVEELSKFRDWVPHTKKGIFKKYSKGE